MADGRHAWAAAVYIKDSAIPLGCAIFGPGGPANSVVVLNNVLPHVLDVLVEAARYSRSEHDTVHLQVASPSMVISVARPDLAAIIDVVEATIDEVQR